MTIGELIELLEEFDSNMIMVSPDFENPDVYSDVFISKIKLDNPKRDVSRRNTYSERYSGTLALGYYH